MQILDFQVIGSELAIKWVEGGETFLPLEQLRRHCPCAGCKGEMDVMGNLYKGPEVKLTPESFRLQRIDRVGGYALQPIWADGHATGLFSFEYLQTLGQGNGDGE
jgi:DUF971 family protein